MKKVLSVLGGIISFVICAILVVYQMACLLFINVRTILNENVLSSLVENVNVTEVLKSNPQTVESVYKATGSIGLTIDDTDKILDSKALKELLVEVVSGNVKGMYSEAKPSFTSERIEKLIDDVEKETGVTIENKDKILELINENSDKISETLNISANLKNELDSETLSLIDTAMGPAVVAAFIIVFVMFYLLISLFRWSLYKPFIWVGITSIVSGFLFLIPSIFMGVVLPMLLTNDLAQYSSTISSVLKLLQTRTILFSLSFVVLGIIFIVLYSLIRKKKNVSEEDKQLESL